jgi:hypothetical protein
MPSMSVELLDDGLQIFWYVVLKDILVKTSKRIPNDEDSLSIAEAEATKSSTQAILLRNARGRDAL